MYRKHSVQTIEQRIEAKREQLKLLQCEVEEMAKRVSELTEEDPEVLVRKHISGLKKYNELRDVALGLITMIADQRQLKMVDIMDEMGLEDDK